MKHLLKTLVKIAFSCLSFFGSMKSQAQSDIKLDWAKAITGNVHVRSIGMDAAGNTVLTGNFYGTADFDPSLNTAQLTSPDGEILNTDDIFIAKYDRLGNYIWAKNIGGSGYDGAADVTVSQSGEIYVTGRYDGNVDFDPGPNTAILQGVGENNIFIAKYDGSGEHLWSRGIISEYNMGGGRSLSIDSRGNLYVTGGFVGTTDFDPGPGEMVMTSKGYVDIFLVKYDEWGQFLWAKTFGGTGFDEGTSLAVDGSGNINLTGDYDGMVDFDPGDGTSIPNNEFGMAVFFARYDPNGNHIWSKAIGGTAPINVMGISVNKSNQVYITGYFETINDFDPGPETLNLTATGFGYSIFLAKYDSFGNYLWAHSLGGADNASGIDIDVDAEDRVYISGLFTYVADFNPGPGTANLTSAGNDDIFLAGYDGSGKYLFAKGFGSSGIDFGLCLKSAANGRIQLGGSFQNVVDFDAGPGTTNIGEGGRSGFFASYSLYNTKTWIGGNGNWSTPANWSDGIAPNSQDILTVTNGNPRLDVDFTVAGSLTLSATGALTIQPGKTLSVSGTADFGGRPVIIRSDRTGTAQIGTVSGSLTSATQVTVERYIPATGRRWRLLTAPVDGPNINSAWQNAQTWNGSATLIGDGTGTLITGQQQGNAGTANGRGFDFWSAIANSSASVMSYTQRTGQGVWSPLANTITNNAFGGDKAYLLFVRGPRSSAFSSGTANAATTLRPTGTLKQGDRNIPIDGTKGYTLIGNPYPSQIDFDAVYMENGNSSVIKRQFWMWDARMGTTGNFIAVVFSGWKYVEVPARFHMEGDGSPLVDIPSGHGFFVLPLTSSGGTLRIREKHKTPKSSLMWPNILLNEDRTHRVWLNLVRRESDGSSLTADGVMAAYGETHRMESTDAEDAWKLENIQENLAILNDGASLTADARPISKMNEPIRLRAWNLNSGGYRFEAKIEGMEDLGINAFLEDRHKGTRTPLKMDGDITSIDLTVGEDQDSRAEDRFRIVFERTAVNASLTPEADGGERTLTLYPNPLTGQTINVKLNDMPVGEYTLQFVGSDGTIVATKKVRHDEGASVHRIELNGILPKGAYQVRCLSGNKSVGSVKMIVQ